MQSIPRMETMTTIEDSCPLYASISTYVSTPRNRQIAKMVKEMGMIEKYGSGIRRIFSSFEQEKLPEPQFCNISDGFMVTVFCENIDIKLGDKLGGKLGDKQILILDSIKKTLT